MASGPLRGASVALPPLIEHPTIGTTMAFYLNSDQQKLTAAQRWSLILPAMRRPHPLTALAAMCGVSTRQIARDIRKLREMGHRIEIKNQSAGYVEGAAPADFALARLFSSELKYLIELAQAFGIGHIAESVEALFGIAPEIQGAAALPLVTSHTPLAVDDELRATLRTVQRAMDSRQVISFDYRDKAGVQTTRTARPVIFVIHQGLPYLVAFDLKRNDWRSFNTMNILDIVLTPSTFAEYDRAKVLKALEHSPSRLFTGKPETMSVRFHGVAAAQARRSHVVSASRQTDRDGDLFVDLIAADRHESFLWLLGFGENVEVLAPPDARREYGQLAGAIAQTHSRDLNLET